MVSQESEQRSSNAGPERRWLMVHVPSTSAERSGTGSDKPVGIVRCDGQSAKAAAESCSWILCLAAAAHALDIGDVLSALSRVALRNDAPGLALRGIALSRLGKRERARELLQRAAKAFGSGAPLGRARCLLADAEIALATRDLRGVEDALARASRELRALGDPINALHADCLAARGLLLRGRLGEAERALQALEPRRAPAPLRAEIYLAWVELHLRTPNARAARAALREADRAARTAGIAAISQEVRTARALLDAPAARLIQAGSEQLLGLSQVESLQRAPRGLLVDARESSVSRRESSHHVEGACSAVWPRSRAFGSMARGGDAARATGTGVRRDACQ